MAENKEKTEPDLTYKVKCRGCGYITKMYFKGFIQTKSNFEQWVKNNSTTPIEKQCDCDKGSILFHDIISYKINF